MKICVTGVECAVLVSGVYLWWIMQWVYYMDIDREKIGSTRKHYIPFCKKGLKEKMVIEII